MAPSVYVAPSIYWQRRDGASAKPVLALVVAIVSVGLPPLPILCCTFLYVSEDSGRSLKLAAILVVIPLDYFVHVPLTPFMLQLIN